MSDRTTLALLTLALVGVILDLCLSAFTIYFSIEAKNASSSAHLSRVAVYEACVAGNDYRKGDAEIWNGVLSLIPTDTPEASHFVSSIQARVSQVDAPKECGSLRP